MRVTKKNFEEILDNINQDNGLDVNFDMLKSFKRIDFISTLPRLINKNEVLYNKAKLAYQRYFNITLLKSILD